MSFIGISSNNKTFQILTKIVNKMSNTHLSPACTTDVSFIKMGAQFKGMYQEEYKKKISPT